MRSPSTVPVAPSAVLFALLALGCSAQIPDARVTCSDGVCPVGYNCWTDAFCHRAREPEGGVGADDAGMMMGTGDYAPCMGGGVCAAPFTCFEGLYCSPPCVGTPAMCPPGPPSGVCIDGAHCAPTCTLGTSSCPAGAICAIGRWTGTPNQALCTSLARVIPRDHGMACGVDNDCMPPDSCIRGACVRSCLAMGDCGGGENCAPVPSGGGMACIARCPSGTGCPGGFTCMSSNCFPTVWGVP